MIAGSDRRLWHGNYGDSVAGLPKPELVAPSLWVAAPVLPGSAIEQEARKLFDRRAAGDPTADARIAELKLISPAYQHADGTSFAAPIVASAAACMREANPALGPRLIREALIRSAHPVPGAGATGSPCDGSGAGLRIARPPGGRGCGAWLVGRLAGRLDASEVEPGLWRTAPLPLAPGPYQYKFRLDDLTWLPDPANPHRAGDGAGGLNSVSTWGGRA